MGSLFDRSWIPKLGALIGLAGGAVTAAGEPSVGIILTSIGSAIGLFFARQDNRSSEAVGAHTPSVPPVSPHFRPPPPRPGPRP